MLFIQHDQAQLGHRQKDRRACSHHHVGPALAAAAPRLDALTIAEARVEADDAIPKALAAALQQLRHQADLGGEQQHAFALLEHLLAAAQVHLGFARSSHPPQQPLADLGLLLPLLQGLLLLRAELRRFFLQLNLAAHEGGLVFQQRWRQRNPLFAGQGFQQGPAKALLHQLRDGLGAMGLEVIEQRLLALGR